MVNIYNFYFFFFVLLLFVLLMIYNNLWLCYKYTISIGCYAFNYRQNCVLWCWENPYHICNSWPLCHRCFVNIDKSSRTLHFNLSGIIIFFFLSSFAFLLSKYWLQCNWIGAKYQWNKAKIRDIFNLVNFFYTKTKQYSLIVHIHMNVYLFKWLFISFFISLFFHSFHFISFPIQFRYLLQNFFLVTVNGIVLYMSRRWSAITLSSMSHSLIQLEWKWSFVCIQFSVTFYSFCCYFYHFFFFPFHVLNLNTFVDSFIRLTTFSSFVKMKSVKEEKLTEKKRKNNKLHLQ